MKRRVIGAAAALVVLALGPLACSQGKPEGTATPAPPVRTLTVTPVIDYGWGTTSRAINGVSVRVHRPVPRLTSPDELAHVGMRAMICGIEVTNGGRAEVRIGIAGQMGRRVIVPLSEPPASVPPNVTTTVSRVVYVPDIVPATITLHVSATANGEPIPYGWRYVGSVDR